MGEEAPLQLASPPTVGAAVASAFVERVWAWWEGGGKVCLYSVGRLTQTDQAAGEEGTSPTGEHGLGVWVSTSRFSPSPCEANKAMRGVEWIESSGKSIDLTPWMTPSSFISIPSV